MRGRRIAADYERHNAFLALITNAADAPADYEPTFIFVRTCDVACHVCIPRGQKSKSINPFAVQCTPLLDQSYL